MRYPRSLSLALVGAVMLAAMSAAPLLAQEKGGGDRPTTTLSLAVWDLALGEAEPVVADLIALAPEISAGSIAFSEPVWGALDAADLVRAGKVDLAILPTREWSSHGVTSLEALEAPFLIDNDALALAVAASDIATDAMAGLEAVGVTGLAIWPDDMRHLFAFKTSGRVFTNPADFAGSLVMVRASKAGRGLITTLGGELYQEEVANEAQTGDRVLDAESGVLRALVSGLQDATQDVGVLEPSVVAGDVVLFPKYQVLAANGVSLGNLTDEQQGYLAEIVARVQAGALARHEGDAALAAQACARGGTIIEAGAAALGRLRAAARPLTDALASDPISGDLMSRISELSAETPRSAGAAPCATDGKKVAGVTDVNPAVLKPAGYDGTRLLPDGTYRVELTPDSLKAAGAPSSYASLNAGVWTMTIEDAAWKLVRGVRPELCSGTQEVMGDFVRFTTTVSQGCGLDADLAWRPEEAGFSLRVVGLAWSDVAAVFAEERSYYEATVWTRIEEPG